eukprot:13480_1
MYGSYTIDYPEPDKHHWDFDLEWEEKTESIVFTVKDDVTKGKWQAKLGKEQYKNPSKEYDRMLKVFEDKNTNVVCLLHKGTNKINVRFTDSGVDYYIFLCKPC